MWLRDLRRLRTHLSQDDFQIGLLRAGIVLHDAHGGFGTEI
jgi:hypothetical protein